MILSTTNIAIIILAAIAIAAVIGFIFRKDDAIEERRRNMLHLCKLLRDLGLDDFATAAESYAVGDYSDVYRSLKSLLQTLQDPVKANAMLARNFYSQLSHRLTEKLEAQKIADIVLTAARDPVAK